MIQSLKSILSFTNSAPAPDVAKTTSSQDKQVGDVAKKAIKKCANCGADDGIKKCCKIASYCSKECRRQHRDTHKVFCESVKKSASNLVEPSPSEVVRKKSSEDDEKSKSEPKSKDSPRASGVSSAPKTSNAPAVGPKSAEDNTLPLNLEALKRYIESEALTKHIKSKSYSVKIDDVEIDEAQKQISLNIKLNGRGFRFFMHANNNILRMTVMIPCKIQPKAFPDLARLFNKLNNTLACPAFCMDEKDRTSFYRVAPYEGDKMQKDKFNRTFLEGPQIAFYYFEFINAVAAGAASFDVIEPVLDEAKKNSGNEKLEKKKN